MTQRILSSLLTICLTLGSSIAQVPGSEVPENTKQNDRQGVVPDTANIPPIPALSTWKSNMKELGHKWAAWLDNPKNLPLAFGVEQEVWYYDGGRVFYQIADYTHDPKWYKYGDQILSAYADYVIANDGGLPGYRIFPYGLWMGWQRTQNPKYQQALTALLYGKSSGARMGGNVELRYYRQHGTSTKAIVPGNPINPQWVPSNLRESAYITDVLIVDWLRTGKQHPLLQVGVYDCVVADLNAFMTPDSSIYNGAGTKDYVNNFMVGLALETLRHYYDVSVSQGKPDAAVLPVIDKVLDFMWDNAIEHPSGALIYNSDSVNGKDKASGKIATASNTNQLIAASYAWRWLMTKDPNRLTQADTLFQAGVRGAGKNSQASITNQDYSYMGKEFSTNYKDSFDFVRYRSGNPKSTVFGLQETLSPRPDLDN